MNRIQEVKVRSSVKMTWANVVKSPDILIYERKQSINAPAVEIRFRFFTVTEYLGHAKIHLLEKVWRQIVTAIAALLAAAAATTRTIAAAAAAAATTTTTTTITATTTRNSILDCNRSSKKDTERLGALPVGPLPPPLLPTQQTNDKVPLLLPDKKNPSDPSPTPPKKRWGGPLSNFSMESLCGG